MRSSKRIKELDEIVLPYKTTFPETIEGGINKETFIFKKGEEVELTFPQYEILIVSDYAKYLRN